jgi:proline racemase
MYGIAVAFHSMTGGVQQAHEAYGGATQNLQQAAPSQPPSTTTSQQQAVISAQNYMSLNMGFSRESLIAQLRYEGFSESDSEYAASAVGLQ